MGNQNTKSANKIKKYRKPRNINIGMVIFGFIFVYIIICIFSYLTAKHVMPYEVKEGSLSSDKTYKGIIIRDETVVTNEKAGYINYYARDGERIAVGDLVYAVDETGQLSEYVQTADLADASMEASAYQEIKTEISNFVHNFSPNEYSKAYDFKYDLKNTVLKLTSNSMLDNLAAVSAESGAAIQYNYANITGIVSFWIDGYESLTAQQVSKEMFEQKDYKKQILVSNELVEQGAMAYKVCTNENWSVVIPFEAERGAEIVADGGYIKVRFLKNQYEAWASVEMLSNEDGNSYMKLTFNNSMLTFASERFLDIELLVNEELGLKIPNSSIVEREFFLIPSAYITKGGKKGEEGVLKQSYAEDGTATPEFIETTIYNVIDDEYYLDDSTLRIGDILIMPESTETYVVSKRATLIGVYNINKGYADFRRIDILYQNEEYAIVKSNSKYGLNVYDFIVLDATTVDENEFIYK